MKKFQYFVIAGAAMALASCSSNEPAPAANDDMVNVTITAGLDLTSQSRVLGVADAAASRCFVQIIDQASGTEKVGDKVVALTSAGPNEFSANLSLYKHKSYTLLFWADNGSVYTTTDLKKVTLADGADAGIAWAANKFTVNGTEKTTYKYSDENGAAISATLSHVVAKVTLATTTALPAQTLTLSGMEVGSVYDVSTMSLVAPTGSSNVTSAHSYSYAIAEVTEAKISTAQTEGDNGVTLFSCYALVNTTSDGNQDLKISGSLGQEITVTNVPVNVNYHTILLGDVTGESTVAFNVTCNTNWANNDPVETPITQ